MSDISHITLPDSNTYDLVDASKSGIYTVIGTQTSATVNLTGNIHNISALYDGLTIVYYSPTEIKSNQSWDKVNLNLTLDDGTTTGAINCWIGDNSSGRYVTTADGLSSKHTLVMTYWSSATWGSSNSDKWVILSGDELTKITRSTFGSMEWPIPLVSFNTLNTNYSFDRVYVPHPNNNIPLKFNPSTGNLVTTQLNGTPINGYAKQVSLTQAEYDALVSAGTVDLVSTVYFITDGNANACSAAEVSYDNTTSGLTSDDVQGAIDELAAGGGSGVSYLTVVNGAVNIVYDDGT